METKRGLIILFLFLLTPLVQGGQRETLCHVQEKLVPSWACSCGAWKSEFNRLDKCLSGELSTEDLDCDGLTNLIDPLPFVPYQTYEWTLVRPDFWRQYRIRYDETEQKYVVRLKLLLHFPDRFPTARVDEILSLWTEVTQNYFSNGFFQLELILRSNRQSALLQEEFDYSIQMTTDHERSWALHWSLQGGTYLEPPHRTLFHEIAHLIGLNDAYSENDQKIFLLKYLLHHADPNDLHDKESLMTEGNMLRPHHIFRVLGNGSCPSLRSP